MDGLRQEGEAVVFDRQSAELAKNLLDAVRVARTEIEESRSRVARCE